MLASRVSTWPRDHFCRSAIAASVIETHDVERVLADIDANHGNRSVEFLRHGVLLARVAPMPALLAGGAGARPDHSITGHSRLTAYRPSCLLRGSIVRGGVSSPGAIPEDTLGHRAGRATAHSHPCGRCGRLQPADRPGRRGHARPAPGSSALA